MCALPWKSVPLGPRKPREISRALAPRTFFLRQVELFRILLVLHRPISDLQPLVDNRKRLPQLLLVDAKGWICVESIPPHQGIKPILAEELPQRDHLLRG